MVRNLIGLGRYMLGPAINFRDILGETLFMMMLIELLRLLALYLRDVVELSPGTIVAIALFVITLGILLRFGDLRVRRSRVGRADALFEGHASRLRRRPPSVTRGARPEPLSSPE
jgi:hypothetical protein